VDLSPWLQVIHLVVLQELFLLGAMKQVATTPEAQSSHLQVIQQHLGLAQAQSLSVQAQVHAQVPAWVMAVQTAAVC